MEHKHDIGSNIAQRLAGTQKAPSEQVWERINSSIEKEERRKGKSLLWWYVTGGLGLALLVIISVNWLLPFNQKPSLKLNPPVTTTEDHDKNIKNKATPIDSVQLESKQIRATNDSEIRIETPNQFQRNQSTSQDGRPITNNVNVANSSTKIENKSSTLVKNNHVEENNPLPTIPNSKDLGKSNTIESSNDQILESDKKLGGIVNRSINDSSTKETTISERQKAKELIDSLKADRDKKLEDRIAKRSTKQEETTKSDTIENRRKNTWSVSAIAAPVLFEASRNSSTIDKDLVGKDKSARINFAYGVGVHFALSDQFSLNYHVIKTKLGYTTNDIQTGSPADSTAILSYTNLEIADGVTTASVAGFVDGAPTTRLLQEIEYIEMPLQLSYRLSENRFGVHVYGGISTYLLTDNELYLENQAGDRYRLGSSRNLSKVNFSVNAGVGLYYNLSKQLTFTLDPTFKYQFNTLDNISFDGKTYLLGVYTGIRYNLNFK